MRRMPKLAANLSILFSQLEFRDRFGYAGWIRCEYNPIGDTLEGLEWAKPYL